MKKYTREHLDEIEEAYERNFERLLKASQRGDSKMHDRYKKRELKLQQRAVEIRKAVGNYIKDPCKLGIGRYMPCYRCTGWYISEFKYRHRKNVMVAPHTPEAVHCYLRRYFKS